MTSVAFVGECDEVTRYLSNCLEWTSSSTSTASEETSESLSEQGTGKRRTGANQVAAETYNIKQASIVPKEILKLSGRISRKMEKQPPNILIDASSSTTVMHHLNAMTRSIF